jgi:BirA family biotin operon repressor/biotin-[acetyl-CoA-carboxylase] ligase
VKNLLDADRIQNSLSGLPRAYLDDLEVFAETESTNSYLLSQPGPAPGRFRVAMAEQQTAGRGRLNRTWYSTLSSGICLSVSYTFARRPQEFSSLTLAIGANIAEALDRLGIRGIGLKWPNDIVIEDAKVGGILTEVLSAAGEDVTVVVGIGLNVDFRHAGGMDSISSNIGRVTDLASCCDELPDRSVIAVRLIECVFDAMLRFSADGFAPFIDTWQRFDWLRGQHIRIELTGELVPGVAQGIDVDGTLILETETGRRRIVSGSVHFGD